MIWKIFLEEREKEKSILCIEQRGRERNLIGEDKEYLARKIKIGNLEICGEFSLEKSVEIAFSDRIILLLLLLLLFRWLVGDGQRDRYNGGKKNGSLSR